ncbi:hypothetical protein PHLCEN_2v3591 [Hermanssonia centrifuga]|uniref:UvrD-like helicase ATP-binding domain-containing protein n=1 Tax=Hermanssonia centrifuga TaxID=98765 RepID=A0A2R6QES7_9APHY|nr:hypothetical protein PHLCEN_2v3591 [Hermanssonia centrifuga]
MLFKMLGIERDWDNMNDCLDEKIPHPRQIFVTQSGVLAEKVNEYYTKLSESHAAAKRTAEASAKMASKKQDHQNSGLVDRDEEEFWRGTLPKRYSDLREEHFPLFITFDHLCRLLEADLRDSNKFQLLSPALGDTCTDQGTLANDYMSQRRDCFVSYDIFLKSYWPHFSQALKKNLDPALIFAEFMGIIKGSEQTLQSINGFMDRNAYVNLSHRQQGTFASRRDVVYTLFESYLKLKSERRHWDAADRTHAILLGLKESGVPGQKMDFVYVDEAQDNMLIDALILRTICRRPDGLFWAGDTAQTISVGSSFRFNDLKAFLYRLETTVNTGASIGAPHSFQLTANYRSHGGIVSCAHSVVQLITKFWPHSIDILAEEKGIIDGLKPIFLSGWDQDTVQYEQFLFGSSSSQLEFGAQQCILVRDDVAREKLRAQVGDIGLVLTLYESKGLEFNDVLLYNFFEDSKVDVSQWRVILNALPEEKQIKCPQFDDTRHNGVCRELKFLYVAITRARKNLWLADCSSRAEPIRTLWTSTGLVQHCTASDTQPRIAVSSKPEEWAKTARDLFDNRRYSQAARCYERALLGRERDVAYAYYLREQARETFSDQHTTYNRRSIAFLTAAQAFMRSAAVATIRTENIAYYRNAAECFVEAGDDAKAAEAYGHAEEFTRSAQLYRKAGWFDHAVEVVQSHRSSIAEADAERIIDVAKLHYFKENKLERATNLFPSLDDALQFMDNYDFNVARVNLLESTGRIAEAAELHLNEGRTVEAIRLFIQDSADPDSQRRAEECLLQGLWKQLSFGVHIKPDADISNTPLGELMELSSDMQNNSRFLAPQAQDEISMFQAIATRQLLRLRELAEKFHNVYKDPAATLLCLDHAFDSAPKMNALTHTELTSFLRMFLIYTTELQRILSDIDPSHNPLLQRLFGYHPLAQSENTIAIQSGTFLSSFISENIRKASDHMDPLTLSIWEFTSLFKNAISNRLKERVKTENTACSQAHSLSPCPAFAIFGSCNSNTCYRIHLNGRDLDSDWHHTRIRIIFQQILIYQAVSGIEDRFTVQMQHRFWLEALFNALHPVHHKLGSLSALDLRRFPEAQKGLQIAKHWICDSFYTLSPWSDDSKLFMTIVAETAILGLYFDKTSAQHYINHAPCVASFKERQMLLLRGPADDPRYVVHDLLDSIDGSEKFAISAGVLFIQMVSEKRLTFGIHVMCQLIERLCASFAFAYRFQRFGSLHDLTLMRSWILRLCGDYDAAAAQSTQLLSLFLKPMANILEEVFSGSQGWFAVEQALRASSLYDKRHFDESIQLKEESKLTDTPRYIRGTRTVIFKDGRDIPDLVDRRSTLEAFVPEPDLLPETQVIVQEDMDEPPSVDEEDEGINRNVDAEAAASSVDAGRVNQPPAPPTESEIVAASQIAAFYRRTTSRRKGLPKKGPSEARVRWFLTCRENSQDMGVKYRVLYLGPLPHALACLEGINIHVTALKKKAMSRLVSAQHADLEVVQEQVDRAISITKKTVGLRKLLDPKSQFHRTQSISQLEVNIEQIVKLMSTLHEGVLREWEWDFKIAIKGILQQRKPPAKTPKPELVIDIEEW